MTTSDFDDQTADDSVETANSPEELGGLSVEDDPDGTVDAAELAGTAGADDEDVT